MFIFRKNQLIEIEMYINLLPIYVTFYIFMHELHNIKTLKHGGKINMRLKINYPRSYMEIINMVRLLHEKVAIEDIHIHSSSDVCEKLLSIHILESQSYSFD